MDEAEMRIVLYSLFHDIGKFYMRTHTEEECKGLQTGKSLNHEELLERVKRDSNLENIGYISAISDEEKKYCKVADWITAQEREYYAEEDTKNRKDIRKEPLRPIFDLFTTKKDLFLVPTKLALKMPSDKDFIKKEEIKDSGIFSKQLYEDLKNELKGIENDLSNELKIRIILDIFKKYFVKIPSASYHSEPTIDLYNHSRLTAALSLCLHRYYKNNRESFNKLQNVLFEIFQTKRKKESTDISQLTEDDAYKEKFCILLEGDMSGIQDFITTIHTENARKFLKARSFYIVLLGKIVAFKLLKELDLPETNLLYCSGGNFQIICENSEDKIKKSKDILDKVNNHLFDLFGIKLFFSLKCIRISARDFSNYSEKLMKRDAEIIISKEKKFYNVLLEKGSNIGTRGKDECKICKKEKEVVDDNFCDVCIELQKLDEFIKNIVAGKKYFAPKLEIFSFISDEEIKTIFHNNKIVINKLDEKAKPFELIVTGIPLSDSNIKSLDEICTTKLGAFKFDVDNLGDIFSGKKKDNKNEKIPLSLYSVLSFNLTFYFEGIVNQLWSEKYKDKVYIVYSGGDDGFIIGDYREVLNFAKDIYNYFKIYVGKNECFTLSGAYRVFDITHPIRKVFETLDNDLENAKNERIEKNCISINGLVMRWDYFDNFENEIFEGNFEKLSTQDLERDDFTLFIKFANYLSNLYNKENISGSTLHDILELSSQTLSIYESNLNDRKKLIPNVYMLRYILVRNLKGETDAEKNEILETLFSIWNQIISKSYQNEESLKNGIYKLRSIYAAAQMVELYKREKDMKKGEGYELYVRP